MDRLTQQLARRIEALERDPRVIRLDSGSGLSLKQFAFGLTGYDDATGMATLNGGPVVGFGESVLVADGGQVSIGGTSGQHHYIYAYGTVNPLTAALYPSTVATLPIHRPGEWRVALYEVYLASTVMVNYRILHVGLIDLRTWTGP